LFAELCKLLASQWADEATPWWVRGALFVLSMVWQFLLLPRLTGTIVVLMFCNGSTAVEICFNGVAVMFVLDFDNALFKYWLPELVQAEAEATGRAVVGPAEKRLLTFTKQLHTVAVAVIIPASVLLAYGGVVVDIAASFPSLNVFFLCAAVEATQNAAQKWNAKVLFPLSAAHLAFAVFINWSVTRG
jgi:hypothetical protein